MTEKTDELKQLENALIELSNEIIQGLVFNKIKTKKVSDWLVLAGQYYAKAKDKRFFIKLFFQKIGKTTLYNSLGLKNYYLDFGVGFEYNVKKDKLWILGNPNEIDVSYSDWLQAEKERKRAETERLSDNEKLDKRFKTAFEKLNKTQKTYLITLLKK